MHRIISLIPSATEIVCALGFENRMVGRSHECDFPVGVKTLPVCTEPKIDSEVSSAEIDHRIKEILEKALSIYKVHVDKLKELKPNLIVTQSQCEVCAVSLKDVEKAINQFIGSKPKIVSLEPNSLADIYDDILRVASALDVTNAGNRFVENMKENVKKIEEKSRNLVKPKIGCIEWIEPLMAAGNWVPELVDKAGGKNLFGVAGEHSPWMKLKDLVEMDPDIIVVMPCGFDIERIKKELHVLTKKEEWSKLRAVKNNKVYVVDGNQYFNRPGPRILDSLEILAEIFHPEAFQFGYENKGWEKFVLL